MQVRKGKGRKTMRRKGGRKTTRRRRGGMFGMSSGLTQAEKDAISKRSTYGDASDEVVATVKDYGSESAFKQNALNDQMRRGYTGYTQGKNLAKSILAKTARRG